MFKLHQFSCSGFVFITLSHAPHCPNHAFTN